MKHLEAWQLYEIAARLEAGYTKQDGRYEYRKQFSDMESVNFADYGVRQLALHSHGEVYSLPRIIGKDIRNCEFRYQVDPYAYRMFREGYAFPTQGPFQGACSPPLAP